MPSTTRKTTAPAKPAAVEAPEVPEGRFPVVLGGETYFVTASAEWSYEALLALESGRLTGFIQAILGDEQHEAFRATNPTIGVLNEYIDAIQNAAGVATS